MRSLRMMGLVIVMCGVAMAAEGANAPGASGKKPSLTEATAKLKVPPEWFEMTAITWDTNKPWKDARLEIRRLLGLDEQAVRQAVKLTWIYAQKSDIGNGHELPMYLFMSGNYAWALQEYPKHLETVAGNGATHEYLCLASCYAHFGEYEKAMELLDRASKDLPPAPWEISGQANIANSLGDLYVEMGQIDQAKAAYAEAMRLYPTSAQPYGRHLLPRYVAKVKTKLDLLTFESLGTAKLRDGKYIGKALGYADTKDMQITVTIKGGKMADIQVVHQEKIELNATQIIPEQILAKQSLKVDAITGATVTSQAITDGTYQALKQAGLK